MLVLLSLLEASLDDITTDVIDVYSKRERAKQEAKALSELVESGVEFTDNRGTDPNLKPLRTCGDKQKTEAITMSLGDTGVMTQTATFNLSDLLLLGDKQMYVHHKIAKGAYGDVFKVEVIDEEEEEEKGGEEGDEDFTAMTHKLQVNPAHFRALKWIKSNSVWEFSIFDKIRKRAKDGEGEKEKVFDFLVLQMESFHLYRSSSFLVMPVVVCGTLNDVINKYGSDPMDSKKVVPEELAIVYSYYVMKAIKLCHSCGIIHSDVKPSNFLVSMGRVEEVKRLPKWEGQLDGEWGKFSLKLIDFGRSIDTKAYNSPSSPSSLAPLFEGDEHVEGFRSTKMAEGGKWCFDVDLYGVAGVIHLLLFGKYMETTKKEGEKEMCVSKFARYQQHWQEVFEKLLGFEDEGKHHRDGEACANVLEECCDMLVKFLTSNNGKQRSLRLTFCRLINKMRNTKV